MCLILCEPSDLSAIWAAAELQQRGVRADIVFSSTLGVAERWNHRIVADRAEIEIALLDGRTVSSRAPVAILNRLAFVPTAQLRAVAGNDYGYAVQELYAFYLSWLHAWPTTVVNRPSPQGLSGTYRHASQWTVLAAEAGLPVAPWQQSSEDDVDLAFGVAPAEATAFVIGEACVLPPGLQTPLAEPCRKLADRAETALLGISFVQSNDGWRMSGATPVPELALGGAPVADALARALA